MRPGTKVTTYLPFLLLFVALLIALGFEFVNGFHDTANAVATVIYTRSMPAYRGRLVRRVESDRSSRLLGHGCLRHLFAAPVELVLQVGSGASFAMVFALLISAIIWNLGTSFGLPASSSHTLIGSIIGVGVADALLHGRAASGVDWGRRQSRRRCFSPLFGFASPALAAAAEVHRSRPALYAAEGKSRRPGGSAACLSSPARWSAFSTAPTTARRAWA